MFIVGYRNVEHVKGSTLLDFNNVKYTTITSNNKLAVVLKDDYKLMLENFSFWSYECDAKNALLRLQNKYAEN